MATRLVWHRAMSPRSMTWEEIGNLIIERWRGGLTISQIKMVLDGRGVHVTRDTVSGVIRAFCDHEDGKSCNCPASDEFDWRKLR